MHFVSATGRTPLHFRLVLRLRLSPLCAPPQERCDLSTKALDVFQHGVAGSTAPAAHEAIPLSLYEHLSPPTFDLTRPTWQLGKTLDDVMAFFQQPPFCLQHRLPDGLRLHPATGLALSQLPSTLVPPEMIDGVGIFTDGSFDGSISAWALVVVSMSGGSVAKVEWFASRVEVDQGCAGWFGATEHGSQPGELSALCGVLLWLLAVAAQPNLRIFSDSLTAAMRATGQCNLREDDSLAVACRSLFQALEATGKISADSVSHVFSHRGAAPGTSWRTVWLSFMWRVHLLLGMSLVRCVFWIHDRALPHLWLLIAACVAPQAWPAHVGGGLTDPGCSGDWDPSVSAAWCGL